MRDELEPLKWVVYPKGERSRAKARVVEAVTWIEARRKGAKLLGLEVEQVWAEAAREKTERE